MESSLVSMMLAVVFVGILLVAGQIFRAQLPERDRPLFVATGYYAGKTGPSVAGHRTGSWR